MVTKQQLHCRYHYDPLDRLVRQVLADGSARRPFYRKQRLTALLQDALSHSFIEAGEQLLAQQQSSAGNVQNTLLATDRQRSVLHTAQSGQQQALAYNAYGHQPAGSGLSSLLGFNGELRDPLTGHYLLGSGYRAYNPVLMRFNSPDSLSPFGRGGLNAYAYCAGDPVNYRDPSGHALFAAALSLLERLATPMLVTGVVLGITAANVGVMTDNKSATIAIASVAAVLGLFAGVGGASWRYNRLQLRTVARQEARMFQSLMRASPANSRRASLPPPYSPRASLPLPSYDEAVGPSLRSGFAVDVTGGNNVPGSQSVEMNATAFGSSAQTYQPPPPSYDEALNYQLGRIRGSVRETGV